MITTEVIKEAEDLVREFVEKFDVEAKYSSEGIETDDDVIIKIDLEGENLSELVGYHSKNLESIQHLVNLSFNKDREDRIKIVVDINKYREKRDSYITSYTQRAIVEVKNNNQPMELPAMKPAERRIVHMVVKQETGVVSTSEGEEPNRYVVIKPE